MRRRIPPGISFFAQKAEGLKGGSQEPDKSSQGKHKRMVDCREEPDAEESETDDTPFYAALMAGHTSV